MLCVNANVTIGETMIEHFIVWLRGLLSRRPVRLAIVRRYADANGNYVGELYIEGTFAGVSAYKMIGVSLDNMPLETPTISLDATRFELDTQHDFLASMPLNRNVVRVGAIDPKDNDSVRRMVASLPRRHMSLIIQNRFIEHVLEKKTI